MDYEAEEDTPCKVEDWIVAYQDLLVRELTKMAGQAFPVFVRGGGIYDRVVGHIASVVSSHVFDAVTFTLEESSAGWRGRETE